MTMNNDNPEFFDVGVPPSDDAPFPMWLKAVYAVLPFFGIALCILYWNGSWGWLDRGAWAELQKAANTTFPMEKFPQSDLSLRARDAEQFSDDAR